MGEEGFIYQYVNIPQNAGEEVEMINILTPIVNMDEKNNHYTNTLALSQPVKYELTFKNEENGNRADKVLVGHNDLELKRYERLQKDIFRKKMARMRESEEQRDERLKKDRIRKKQARLNETSEQRKKRLEKDRIRIQRRRAMESDEDRRKRLERNRLSKRIARVKENSSSSSENTSSASGHGSGSDTNANIKHEC